MASAQQPYPLAMFPRLAVRDVAASTAWYRDALGFEVGYEYDEISAVRYREHADLMLVGDRTQFGEDLDGTRGQGVSLYFVVEDQSVDELAERLETYDPDADTEIVETSWHTRELTVKDPDGYELVFSERGEKPDALDATLG